MSNPMTTLLLAALLLTGCATPQPWWTHLERANNTKCLDFVKHMTCAEFLAANERIKPGIVQASQLADATPLEELNGHSPAWLFSQMVHDIERDRATLRTVPECWRTP